MGRAVGLKTSVPGFNIGLLLDERSEMGSAFWNATGGTLTAGTPVYISGYNAAHSMPTVTKADANVSNSGCTYVVLESTVTSAKGILVRKGVITPGTALDTSGGGVTVGDPVYLSNNVGELTLAAGSSVTGQIVGRVAIKAASGTVDFDIEGSGAFSVPGTLTGTNVWSGANSYSLSARILDAAALQFGTPGTDLVLTADGTDVIVTSTGDLVFNDSVDLKIGTGKDIGITWDGTDLLVSQAAADSIIKWGVSGAGINHVFYGDTATRDCTWDQSNDQLLFNDNAKLSIGTGAGAAGDISFAWDATKLVVSQLTANSAVEWGVDGAGMDQVWYGDTASAKLTWDQSADALLIGGAASVRGLRTSSTTAVAIAGATTLTLADSGGIFTVSQAAAYDIDLPSPTTGPGCEYTLVLGTAAANSVTVTVDGGAATFIGTIVNDVTSVIPATGSTLTFVTGTAALGDTIVIKSIATNLYLVQAVTSAAGGITIA